VTYINLILESGTPPKEAQTLARYGTLDMTMGVYARAREDWLAQAVNTMADYVAGMGSREKEKTKAIESEGDTEMPKGGFEPPRLVGTTPSRWRVYIGALSMPFSARTSRLYCRVPPEDSPVD
jgi:hypothetical protein